MQEVYFIGLDSVDGENARCHFARSYFTSNHTGEKCWNKIFTVKLNVSSVSDFIIGQLVEIGDQYGS